MLAMMLSPSETHAAYWRGVAGYWCEQAPKSLFAPDAAAAREKERLAQVVINALEAGKDPADAIAQYHKGTRK